MGQGTENSETCSDRPTEVSVIRFVSRNHTIEEIAPKKEVYMCKQQGCNKVFTNLEDFNSHEALESLKIRFICREPGCGEELSDPGSMWRHYQEWHNNESSGFACPYTRCNSVYSTSVILEEHIESCHRHTPTIPTEPEVICYEGDNNQIDEEISRSSEDSIIIKNTQYSNLNSTIPKNKDLLITKENFLVNECHDNNVGIDSTQETKIIFLNGDSNKNHQDQHRIDLGNLENVFRSGLESSDDGNKMEENCKEIQVNSCSNNEVLLKDINCEEDNDEGEDTYTPKKQRMSRCKLDPYKCEINGCGKTYKSISHFRHHQDSHKLVNSLVNNSNGTDNKAVKNKIKPTTISFFLCKMPGCGAQVNNVTGLWKHYQDNHANSKLPAQTAKTTEVYRCKVQGCEAQLPTSLLYKHFNEIHKCSVNNSTNNDTKTGSENNSSQQQQQQQDVTSTQRINNIKTDFNSANNIKSENNSTIIKNEIDCGD